MTCTVHDLEVMVSISVVSNLGCVVLLIEGEAKVEGQRARREGLARARMGKGWWGGWTGRMGAGRGQMTMRRGRWGGGNGEGGSGEGAMGRGRLGGGNGNGEEKMGMQATGRWRWGGGKGEGEKKGQEEGDFTEGYD